MGFRMSLKKHHITHPTKTGKSIPQDHNKQKQQEERENPYGNTVLVGNWFEERFDDSNDNKAITPGIYGKSSCIDETTLYTRDYTQPIAETRKDFAEFIKLKQQAFSNRLNSENTNIKLCDDEQFYKNITTFKDIMYRIKPIEDCKWGDFDILKKKPKDDFLRGYGNSTKTGLLLHRACEEWREQNTPIDVSHYKNNFKAPVMKPRVLCKGPQRKTSII